MHSLTAYLTTVLVLGVSGQWLAWRLRLPSILILLTFGFALGQFASPSEYLGDEILFPIVSLSVALILFEGGLSLKIRDLDENGRALVGLVTIGILVTFLLTTLAAGLIFKLSWGVAAVAGAILVVSGPTVIIPLLNHVRPVRRIGSLVKWEGIVNDPIGAVLAVLVFEAVVTGGFRHAALETARSMLMTVLIGGVLGGASTLVLVNLLRRNWIPDFLQNPLLLALVLASFAISNALQHESGLVTVTIFGILLANQKSVTVHHLIEFKEILRTLLTSVLFIVLGSRIEMQRITALGSGGAIFLAVLILVIRPVSVLLGTVGTSLSWRARLFLAVMHPRGIVAAAVSSVFALQLLAMIRDGRLPASMVDEAQMLVPIVFLVIIGSVAIYGLAAAPLARLLGMADPNPQGVLFAGADPLTRALAAVLVEEGFEVLLVDTNHANISKARMEKGLRTHSASVLSEYVRERLDFGGIGRLLAMTSNDEVNSLAALQFGEIFGRAGVYQLRPDKPDSARSEPVPPHLRGRYLFSKDATYGMLASRFDSGWTVKSTAMTEEFNYEQFQSKYPDAMLMFIVENSKVSELKIVTADKPRARAQGNELSVWCLDRPKLGRILGKTRIRK